MDRLNKRSSLEKLKLATKFQFETPKGKGSLSVIDIDEMSKTI
jgi:hypothetical protein